MSRVVWKYEVSDGMTAMPPGAEIVHAGPDPDGVACVWALVDPHAWNEHRSFHIYGTGHEVPAGALHIGSWVEGPFVWHLFDLNPPA